MNLLLKYSRFILVLNLKNRLFGKVHDVNFTPGDMHARLSEIFLLEMTFGKTILHLFKYFTENDVSDYVYGIISNTLFSNAFKEIAGLKFPFHTLHLRIPDFFFLF